MTPFLKSVNMSLFNWLFKTGFNILMKYASRIFLLNEILGAKDKIDHLNSWLSFLFKYWAHSEFLSVPLSCSFHCNQALCMISTWTYSPIYYTKVITQPIKILNISKILFKEIFTKRNIMMVCVPFRISLHVFSLPLKRINSILFKILMLKIWNLDLL